ncbi:uncharacterized protein BT62DRAFT_996567 [Guyanagaster necrorhizus]|uniref:Uncharacterized protein n=1 Tax=Guyanagaster necrorhizus TaxID=856835 RepID=A0A9P7VLF8_9AGAR|nr:uncharacterized protein BT62DRAFT_996567 [Guyanagaster necrorhizus MCA 3950]KAG7442647.1 hypothetical protein BT62DRAFT_996567 [Guyanagaster necrorhizus MCA 3950]
MNDEGSSKIPELPTELEREIFELTATLYPGSAYQLTTVSKRVQIWMEILIYQTVVLAFPKSRTNLFLRTVDSRPASFFAGHVKNLYLPFVSYPDAQKVLSVCTGATNLACWMATPSPELLSLPRQPIERLSVSIATLMQSCETHKPAFFHTAFRALTHLDITEPSNPLVDTDWSALYTLPKLTHISIGNLAESHHLFLLKELLANCESLLCLVVISDDGEFTKHINEEIYDKRLKILPYFHYPKDYLTYWKDVQRGLSDFWGYLEDN